MLKSSNPTVELVDEIVTDDRKCVAPNQCEFELTFRKIKRVYGRAGPKADPGKMGKGLHAVPTCTINECRQNCLKF